MFGNMFRGMIYGKGNRPDFSPEDLPANRWALFFQMFKIRWSKLIGLNLLYLLFLAPMLVWAWMVVATFNIAPVELGYIVDGVLVDPVALSRFFLESVQQWLIINIPLSLISGLALPGVTLVCRNWARDQNAWVWADFKDALKTNWKQALGVSFLTNLLIYMLFFAFVNYPAFVGNEILALVLQTVVVVLLVLLLLMQIVIWPMMVTYKNKFRDLLRNSLMLTIARLPFLLLIGVGLALPVLAWLFFPHPILELILIVFFALIGFALYSFICASYANAAFDRFINPHIAGAPVNRGLRPKEIDPEDEFNADVWNQFNEAKNPDEP